MQSVNVDLGSPQALKNSGIKLMNEAEEFQKNYKEICERVNFLKNYWSGSAAERYTKNIESYDDDFKKFYNALLEFGRIVRETGNGYITLEQNL